VDKLIAMDLIAGCTHNIEDLMLRLTESMRVCHNYSRHCHNISLPETSTGHSCRSHQYVLVVIEASYPSSGDSGGSMEIVTPKDINNGSSPCASLAAKSARSRAMRCAGARGGVTRALRRARTPLPGGEMQKSVVRAVCRVVRLLRAFVFYKCTRGVCQR
jgi:hypothetical protein